MMDAIWREWKEVANNDLKLQTDEFLHASIEELPEGVPNRSMEALCLLHDAGYWRGDPLLLTFLFERFVELGLRRVDFGSEEFWVAVFEGGERGLNQIGGGVPIGNFYRLGEVYHTRVKRFNAEARAFDVEFLHFNENTDARRLFTRVLDDVIDRLSVGVSPDSGIGLEIRHPSLQKRILVPFYRADMMNSERVLSVIERVLQSNEEFSLNENISAVRRDGNPTMHYSLFQIGLQSELDVSIIKQNGRLYLPSLFDNSPFDHQ